MESNQIFNEDCLEGMKNLPDKSIDMILCDPPYQATEFFWDKSLNLEKFFSECCRVLKSKRCIALFGVEPFSSKVRMSKLDWYKYDWVWVKTIANNFQNAKCMPLKYVENIMIFSDGTTAAGHNNNMLYNPQELIDIPPKVQKVRDLHFGREGFQKDLERDCVQTKTNYPKNILYFKSPPNINRFHPTQKPTDLLEYLIKTYTNEGEVVLDATIGSGSTAVAAINTNRKFIGYELNEEYFEIAQKRIAEALQKKSEGLF